MKSNEKNNLQLKSFLHNRVLLPAIKLSWECKDNALLNNHLNDLKSIGSKELKPIIKWLEKDVGLIISYDKKDKKYSVDFNMDSKYTRDDNHYSFLLSNSYFR